MPPKACARLLIKQLYPLSFECRERLIEVFHSERKMMKPFTSSLQELLNGTLTQGLKEFELDLTGRNHADGHLELFHDPAFRLFEPQRPKALYSLFEFFDGNPYVMQFHSVIGSRYVPNSPRKTSQISPTVAYARTASRI